MLLLNSVPELHPDDKILLKRRQKGSADGVSLWAPLSLSSYNSFMVGSLPARCPSKLH